MNWEEKRPRITAPRTARPPRSAGARPTHGAKRALSAILAALLTVALLPALPATEGTAPRTAEALVGTSDYSKVFHKGNSFGDVTDFIGDSTLLCASTLDRKSFEYIPGLGWGSGGAFITKKPVSLRNSWEVKFTGNISPIQWRDDLESLSSSMLLGFSKTGEANDLNGYAWSWGENRTASVPGTQSTLSIWSYVHSVATTPLLGPFSGPAASQQSGSFSYDAQNDTVTLSIGGQHISSPPGIRNLMGEETYFFIGGALSWWLPNREEVLCTPDNMQITCTFQSISFPHFDGVLTSALYRLNEKTGLFDTLVSDIDELNPNDIVQVRCIASNTNSAASGAINERFSLHLRNVNVAGYPTQGLVPFVDDAHPVTVNGSKIDTADNPDLLTDAGVPIVIEGYDNPVTVAYYARINDVGAQTIKVSHELMEDTFQVSQLHTLAFVTLQTVPGDKDPDDPSLTPGRDYHYTRLPAANANGWNNTPVAITFYPGDFDELTLSQNGTALDGGVLKAGHPTWKRTADVDKLPIDLQARNTTSTAIAGSGTDTIRIDTQAPALSWDANTGALTASDEAQAGSGKAVSGVWKVRRVKADGRPLAAEDVTPGNAGALAVPVAAEAAPFAQDQTSWDFALTDGKGNPRETIADAQPGFYVAEDAAGNVSPVYEVPAATNPDPGPVDPDKPTPPVDPDKPGNPDDPDNPKPPVTTPTFPTVTPRPDPANPSAPAPKPLEPSQVSTDPTTGLTHAVVQDEIELRTSPEPITPAMMAQLIDERYVVGTSLAGSVTAGPVQLFDAEGNPVATIDRSRPGTWMVEQTFTDAAGNTTTVRLTVRVREGSATVTPGGASGGNGSGGSGANTAGTGTSSSGAHKSALVTHISQLPQTGGILGPCPLHILFVLMMVMASAYSLMRLRQRQQHRQQQRQQQRDQAPKKGWAPFDVFVLGMLGICAAALAWLRFCPFDLLFALATILLCALWATLLRHHRPPPNKPAPTHS